MRVLAPLVALLACSACGQKVDHAAPAASCDPTTMKCSISVPVGGGAPQNQGGDSSTGNDAGALSGQVSAFTSDFFDQVVAFNGLAHVSAGGESGSRITAAYDGTSFQMQGVLKNAGNWFAAAPDQGLLLLPTVTPVDTRAATSAGITVPLARAQDVEAIFLASSGTERSADRAQLVLHVVDTQGASLKNVHATATAEIIAYRAAASWLQEDAGTDDSGMIFLGNLMAVQALTTVSVNLSGGASARVDARIMAGAVTVVTVQISK
jgi:hypothetical protein